MNRKVLVSAGVVSAVMLMVVQAFGANSSGFNFLKIGTGAKALGMGGAYSAIADGKDAMYWNAAGLSEVRNSEMGTTYMDYVVGIKSGYVSYALPLGGKSGLGIAVNYLDYGKMQETSAEDMTGATLSEFSAYDLAYSIGYGTKLGDRLAVGLNVGMVKEKIKDYEAQGIMGDAGLKYSLVPGKIELGLVGKNIGTQTKAFISEKGNLPTEYHLGVGYKLNEGLVLGLEGVNDSDNSSVRAGAEYNWRQMVSLRMGFNSLINSDLKTGSSKDSTTGFSGGLGLAYRGISVDYSYVPFNELGDVHRMSLGLKFGAAVPVVRARKDVIKKENKEGAIRRRSKLEIKNDGTGEAYYTEAVGLRKEAKYDQALKSIKIALKLEKKQGKYWAELGNIYSKIGDVSKAIKAYEKASVLDPANEVIKGNLEKLKKRISRL